MTDEEIVKALEEEIYSAEYKDDFFTTLTRVSLLKEALSLINRQRIEIEGLKRDYTILNKRFEQQKENSVYDNKPTVIGDRHTIDPCLICENYMHGINYRQKSEIERLTKQMEWLTGYNSNLIDANTALSGEIELLKEAEENLI